MAYVYLALGSNCRAQHNIGSALDCLTKDFGELQLSRVYRNQSLDLRSSDFLNLAIGFSCVLPLEQLIGQLKRIENTLERVREPSINTQVTIDLDVLTYSPQIAVDDYQQCAEISRRSFVLAPMAELAGEMLDQLSGKSYAQLWREFDKMSHPLEEVALQWAAKSLIA